MKKTAENRRRAAGYLWLLMPATAALLLFCAAGLHGQPASVGNTKDITRVVYYPESPQVKSRLSGSDAQPLAGGLLVIKQLKLEMFATNGEPQALVEAPECIYDTLQDTANSAGHLELQSSDGRVRVEGDGFLWQQSDNSLTISNHVYTVVKTAAWKLAIP